MYERFTDGARHLVVRANVDRERLGHAWVQAEHILVALFAEKGLARAVLDDLNVDPDRARRALLVAIRSPDYGGPNRPATGKRVIENCIAEARRLGHQYVGTEHILLALLREVDGPSTFVWQAIGLTYETALGQILARLTPPPAEDLVPP